MGYSSLFGGYKEEEEDTVQPPLLRYPGSPFCWGGGSVPFKIWRAGSTEKIKVKAYSNDEVK